MRVLHYQVFVVRFTINSKFNSVSSSNQIDHLAMGYFMGKIWGNAKGVRRPGKVTQQAKN